MLGALGGDKPFIKIRITTKIAYNISELKFKIRIL